MIYNNTPHGALGDTPYFSVFGVDCLVPGLSAVTPQIEPKLRKLYLRDRWVQFQDLKETKDNSDTTKNISVGDIISYELPEPERKKIQHVSGCRQYLPHWSLPHRVKEVCDNTVLAKPLCNTGKVITVPLSKVQILDKPANQVYAERVKALLDCGEIGKSIKRQRRADQQNPTHS